MRVLIAEDEQVQARLLAHLICQEGREVIVANDGEQAWQLYQQNPVPPVITDWVMPQMDGLELCRKLRQSAQNRPLFIIMLTTLDQKEAKLTALGAGADSFLNKPVEPAELRVHLKVASRILEGELRLQEQNSCLQNLNEDLQSQAEELRRSQRLIEYSKRRFSALFENLPIACFTLDAEGIAHEWNRVAEQLYGLPKTEVLFAPVWERLFKGESATRMRSILQQVLAGELVTGIEMEQQDAEGNSHYLIYNAFPLRSLADEVVGSIVAVVDVTERVQYERQLKIANEQLRNLAVTDGLTGVYNHRAFQEFLEQEFEKAQRYGTPLALILMDIDHFKQLNDTFGHQAGDEVLKQVAQILRENKRRSDILARYGGEEFALILPFTKPLDAEKVAERLRKAVESAEWKWKSVTGSFGVASYQKSFQNRQQLIEAADQALYRAKAEGRNRVCLTPPDLPPASNEAGSQAA